MNLNIIPKDGGNTFSGSVFGNTARGLDAGQQFHAVAQGPGPEDAGRTEQPVRRGWPWVAAGSSGTSSGSTCTARQVVSNNTVPGMWVNKNANNPNSWAVDFDLSQPAFTDTQDRHEIVRLTWQASQRHKLTGYWQEQHNYIGKEGGGTPTQTPEGTGLTSFKPSRIQQLTWTFAINNKLLAEAGIGTYLGVYDQSGGGGPRIGGIGGVNNPAMIQQLEQTGNIIPSCSCSIPGLISRHPGLANGGFSRSDIGTHEWRASIVVCQRRAQYEVWLPGRVQHADQELLLRQHRHPGPDEQRCAQSNHAEPRLPRLASYGPPRHPSQLLRAGSVDEEETDAAGWRAVR